MQIKKEASVYKVLENNGYFEVVKSTDIYGVLQSICTCSEPDAKENTKLIVTLLETHRKRYLPIF